MSFRLSLVPALAATALLAACGATGSDPTSFSTASESAGTSGVTTNAAIRLRCDLRTGRRSRISADGRGLAAGRYTMTVVSGSNSATAPAQAAVAGQAEFDFDSNPADIAAGATAISRNFIQVSSTTGDVTAKLFNAAGSQIASTSTDCAVR